MLKISLVALVGLCVVMACGCVGTSKPSSIEILTNNLGVFDESSGKSIEEVYVVLYDSNGNSVTASGELLYTVSSASVKMSGEVKPLEIFNNTSIKLKNEDFTHTQYGAFETDSNQYVKAVTKDVYSVCVCGIIYNTHSNMYMVRNYAATKEGGFNPAEFDAITTDMVFETHTMDGEPGSGIGTFKRKNLLVQVDFKPDGSDSTIHAEKLLTA